MYVLWMKIEKTTEDSMSSSSFHFCNTFVHHETNLLHPIHTQSASECKQHLQLESGNDKQSKSFWLLEQNSSVGKSSQQVKENWVKKIRN